MAATAAAAITNTVFGGRRVSWQNQVWAPRRRVRPVQRSPRPVSDGIDAGTAVVTIAATAGRRTTTVDTVTASRASW